MDKGHSGYWLLRTHLRFHLGNAGFKEHQSFSIFCATLLKIQIPGEKYLTGLAWVMQILAPGEAGTLIKYIITIERLRRKKMLHIPGY